VQGVFLNGPAYELKVEKAEKRVGAVKRSCVIEVITVVLIISHGVDFALFYGCIVQYPLVKLNLISL
jgi:hypothetical protein